MIYPSTFENKIGFDRIRQMVSEACLCQLGRNQVEAIQMLTDRQSIAHAITLVDELRSILLFNIPFPQDNFIDLTTQLAKIKHPGTFLDTGELLSLRKCIATIRSLEQFFRNSDHRDKYPALCSQFAQLTYFPFIGDLIDEVLTKEGQVKDGASPELKQLRSQKKQKQVALTRKIQSIMRTAQQNGLVEADAEITLREGRPVIPVSAGNKRKLNGLIHDESASGKTVYIEPVEVVELNNQLRELEYAERREIVKILTLLADAMRPYLGELQEAFRLLGEVDFIRAKAKFALTIHGVRPILSTDRSMSWRQAIHPLLYLAHKAENKEVVPLDLNLTPDGRIVLISGPNAGGKSVCLKTLGLLQYMLQCGLLIPLKENSEVHIFEHILIDIGDEQSIENDLSTYSGHLLHMKNFIRMGNPATLILIDEFGTGTEPALGGAIAEAILEELNTKGVYGVITTHYANLKHFASDTPGIVNGAMLFDTQQIKPLFQLSVGKPGSSFAIEIARKIGLPENILQAASDKVGSDYVNFEKHLREIIRDKKYWEEKRQKIRRVERTLDDKLVNYSDELDALQKERKLILKTAREEAKKIISEANSQVERTIREIKERQADKEYTREARRQLELYKRQVLEHPDKADEISRKMEELERAGKELVQYSPELNESGIARKKKDKTAPEELPIAVGDRVRMKGMDTRGEVLDTSGKNFVVAFGEMITTISPDKIERVGDSNKVPSKKGGVKTNVGERRLNFKPEIDVRGMRGDEAIAAIQNFIDDAVMVSSRKLRILHGKGNGILRQLIRDYLKATGLVKTMHDAHADLGGAGITLVELNI